MVLQGVEEENRGCFEHGFFGEQFDIWLDGFGIYY